MAMGRVRLEDAAWCGVLALTLLALACGSGESTAPEVEEVVVIEEVVPLDRAAVRKRARGIFGVLPEEATLPDDPVTDTRVELGRVLYFDPRLSKNHDVSCNSCHPLDRFGADGEATSPGHRGQRGDRNSPSVYNAALHLAQFWDGRAADVEEQAKDPVLNPIEMAMPSEAAVVAVLESIPGYRPLFEAAFPDHGVPITYDNMARAIGAFERRLMTPSPFDAFLEGNDAALTDAQVEGLDDFMNVGCITCHMGPAVGGRMYQKLGAVKPYPTEDPGRQRLSGNDVDRHVFKVPSLRNAANTGPWFHDGSIERLDRAVVIMAEYQLGRALPPDEVRSLVAFLQSLTGTAEASLVEPPDLPESGPKTPKPDPT